MSIFSSFFKKNEVARQNDPAVADGNELAGQTTYTTVPNITFNQLLDIINGGGDDGLAYAYKPRLYTRNLAICQSTLHRAVTLIACITGQLLSQSSFRIVTADGKVDKSPKADALRDLFSYSLDGINPASYTIQKAMADYLLDGNFLFIVHRESRDGESVVTKLERCVSWSASIYQHSDFGYEYDLEPAELNQGKRKRVNWAHVVHGKWAQLQRVTPGGGSRHNFSIAPVQVMRPTFKAGLALDQYILKFAERAPYQNLAINLKEEIDFEILPPEQRQEIKDHIAKEQRAERGFSILQETDVSDMTPKIDKNLADIRKEQRKEIGIVYGLPGPVLGDEVSSWGQGIAELGRLAKTYGFAIHVQQFCDAVAFRCLNPGSRIEVEYHKLVQSDPAGVKALIEVLRGKPGEKPLATEAELRRFANLPEEYEGELIVNPNPNEPVNTDPDGGGDGSTDGEDDSSSNDEEMKAKPPAITYDPQALAAEPALSPKVMEYLMS